MAFDYTFLYVFQHLQRMWIIQAKNSVTLKEKWYESFLTPPYVVEVIAVCFDISPGNIMR